MGRLLRPAVLCGASLVVRCLFSIAACRPAPKLVQDAPDLINGLLALALGHLAQHFLQLALQLLHLALQLLLAERHLFAVGLQ
jgi:hypothetical protein